MLQPWPTFSITLSTHPFPGSCGCSHAVEFIQSCLKLAGSACKTLLLIFAVRGVCQVDARKTPEPQGVRNLEI